MDILSEFLNRNAGLWENVGFYTFFLGLFILLAILLPLLFERERWLLPSIIVSLLLVSVMVYALERKGPLIPDWGEKLKIVYLTETKIVKEPAEQPPGSRRDSTRRPSSIKPRTPRKRTTSTPKSRPAPTRVSRPSPEPTSKKTDARTEAPAPSPTPKREPSSPAAPTGKRADDGLVLPTGTLVIKVTSTLLMVVPREAKKATMSIYVDGRYVGGRRASSLKRQTDGEGNILNVTYFWKGAIIRLTNRTTGNHRISVKLRISGNGVSKSRTSWSGTVHVGENRTSTIVLKGGWGETLHRIQ